MTAAQLQDILVARLTRNSGGTARRWRIVIGPVIVHDPATYPHCNWEVRASGGSREIAAVETLLDCVRLEHPIVAAD